MSELKREMLRDIKSFPLTSSLQIKTQTSTLLFILIKVWSYNGKYYYSHSPCDNQEDLKPPSNLWWRITTFFEVESQDSKFYLSWQVLTETWLYQTVSWKWSRRSPQAAGDCPASACCPLRSWKPLHYLQFAVWSCSNWKNNFTDERPERNVLCQCTVKHLGGSDGH